MKKYKIIINVVLALLFIVLVVTTFVVREAQVAEAREGMKPDPRENFGYFLMLLTVPIILSHYAVLWRGAYHLLTDRPHKIIYTVVDVISIISMAFTMYLLFGSFIFYNLDTTFLSKHIGIFWWLWLPYAFLALRAVCFAAYKSKKPLPVGTDVQEN